MLLLKLVLPFLAPEVKTDAPQGILWLLVSATHLSSITTLLWSKQVGIKHKTKGFLRQECWIDTLVCLVVLNWRLLPKE